MTKKIKITQRQLVETICNLGLQEDNVSLELGGDPHAPLQQRVKKTVQTARENGMNVDKIDVNIPNEVAMKESKNTFTKSQVLNARKSYLKENSQTYTKEKFLKNK